MDWNNHLLLLNRRYRIVPLVLGTLLALALLAVRMRITRSVTLRFMSWNLLLAWVPYWAALGVASIRLRRPGARWRVLPLALVWLLFLPNALYLVTDLIHLRHVEGAPPNYDVALLASMALAGVFLAVFSLRMIQDTVRAWYGAFASWLTVLLAAGLCGAGIYMGRVLRWNSWDALINPQHLLRDLASELLPLRQLVHVAGFSGVFAGMLLAVYLLLPQPDADPCEPHSV